MKAFKTIGIILGVLVAVWLVASLVIEGKQRMEHSKMIKAPIETVFGAVNDLSTWDTWSYWTKMDTPRTVTLSSVPSGKGATYTWKGKKSEGVVTIAESTPNSNIKLGLDFKEHGTATGEWKFEQVGDSVKATESFETEVPFVFKVFFVLRKGAMKEDFETDLTGLKNFSEKAPAPKSNEVSAMQQVDVPVQWVIALRDTAKRAEMETAFGAHYQRIMTYLGEKKTTTTGPYMALWYNADHAKDFYDFAAGFPIADSIAAGKGLRVFKIGGSKAVKTTHWGDYDNMQSTYDGIMAYMQQNKVSPAGIPWEVYLASPMMEKDTAKWQTDIYFPI